MLPDAVVKQYQEILSSFEGRKVTEAEVIEFLVGYIEWCGWVESFQEMGDGSQYTDKGIHYEH